MSSNVVTETPLHFISDQIKGQIQWQITVVDMLGYIDAVGLKAAADGL